TYNNKIKVCDPSTLTVKTFAGDGKPGSEDDSPRFYQPGGLSVAGDSLYVADEQSQDSRDRYQFGSGQDARDCWPQCSSVGEGCREPGRLTHCQFFDSRHGSILQ